MCKQLPKDIDHSAILRVIEGDDWLSKLPLIPAIKLVQRTYAQLLKLQHVES